MEDVKKELRKLWLDLKAHDQSVRVTKSEISKLQKSKNKHDGQERVTVKDKELAFVINKILSEKIPATKAFERCAFHYGKPKYWVKKVKRYKPLPEQVERVFKILEAQNNLRVKTLSKYNKLKIKDIMYGSEFPGFLRKLKQLQIMAEEAEKRDSEVKTLNAQVLELKSVIASQEEILKQGRQINTEEYIKRLRKEFPTMTIAEIARNANVSRNTVYKFI